MPIKVLLDTDIGTDIDDAVCLAYLLTQPDCELLGITTVTGQAEERAKIASALCHVAQKDVPIYPGAEEPLLVPQKQIRAQQAEALAKWPHCEAFPKGEAVEFLRQTIRKHPGEVVLLTIGPLTNIALLFKVDPEIPQMLKALVQMCGVYERFPPGRLTEWNAKGDSHATAIVLRAGVKTHRLVGLDVTTRVRLSAEDVRKRFAQHPLLRCVLDFAEVWFRERDEILFHDPLAAATIFDAGICEFERGLADVELGSERLLGFTHWERDSHGPHEVAVAVNPERFFQHFFSVFGARSG
jgi:inosine-uridine nucleoside N-ribohydrolase